MVAGTESVAVQKDISDHVSALRAGEQVSAVIERRWLRRGPEFVRNAIAETHICSQPQKGSDSPAAATEGRNQIGAPLLIVISKPVKVAALIREIKNRFSLKLVMPTAWLRPMRDVLG